MAVDPMKAGGVQVLVERAYRESGQYQWVRETYKNAEEAKASRIEFTVEWTGVANRGVYRRLIADDGVGMAPDQLEGFINVFGGSGKPIGGEHENYGIGSKTSLLPWNRAGVVIISWFGGEPSMVQLEQDPTTGEYGLHVFSATDEDGTEVNETVIEPYDDSDGETGVDWTLVSPDWIRTAGHGTVIVLLGNSLDDDTVLGAPGRKEDATKGLLKYLNGRLWEIPDGVEVYADVFSRTDKRHWPTAQGADGYMRRQVRGARHYVEWTTKGGVASAGVTDLPSGVRGRWWLRDETELSLDYAPSQGFVGVLYRNELFDLSAHPSTFRSFGIANAAIRRRLYVVLEPALAGATDGVDGVYPNTSRNGLLIRDASGERAGDRIPVAEWGEQFAELMPAEVREAVAAALTGKDTRDDLDASLREKIAARFSSRWSVTRLKARAGGADTVTPTTAGTAPRIPRRARRRRTSAGGGTGGLSGGLVIGTTPGPLAAGRTKVKGSLPEWKPGTAADVGEAWILASYVEHGGTNGEPLVLINAEHPVMRSQIEYYQGQFPPQYAEEVADEVVNSYGLVAATKVAHAESLRAVATPQQVADMRSEAALTAALLGLYAEDRVIAPRLTSRYGRAKKSA